MSRSEELVRIELLRGLYSHTTILQLASVLNAALVVGVLPAGRGQAGTAWLTTVFLWSLVRWTMQRNFGASTVSRNVITLWEWRFAISSVGTGVLWGLASILFFGSGDLVAPVLLTFVIGGMAAGAATTTVSFLPAFYGYVFPAVSPLIVKLLLVGDDLHVVMGAMLLVFGVAVTGIGRATHARLVESTRLRFENSDLVAELVRAEREVRESNLSLERRVQERTVALEEASRRGLETERKLHRARRVEAVGHLTGGIAHDFNNLLTVILGNLQLIRERSDDPRVMKLAEAGSRAGERGARLVKSLLAFARKESLSPSWTDVGQLVNDLLDGVVRQTMRADIELEYQATPDVWPVFVDAIHLETALLNLIVNARDAMPDGGSITIRLENFVTRRGEDTEQARLVPGEYVRLSVIDTGPGIPAAVAERIFEPFYTTKAVGQGTGLGLSMVYGFVAQSGGGVSVKSQETVGTTFDIYLPRAGAAADGVTVVDVSSGELLEDYAGKTVLMVEDDEQVRPIGVEFCRRLGFQVIAAASGDEAWAILAEREVDLLFADLVLTGSMDGAELSRRAVERYPGLPILVSTGYDPEDTLGRTVGWHVLKKPYRGEDLARAVATVMHRGSQQSPRSA